MKRKFLIGICASLLLACQPVSPSEPAISASPTFLPSKTPQPSSLPTALPTPTPSSFKPLKVESLIYTPLPLGCHDPQSNAFYFMGQTDLYKFRNDEMVHIAGKGEQVLQDGLKDQAGFVFLGDDCAVNQKGDVYVGDVSSHLRVVSPEGQVTTLTNGQNCSDGPISDSCLRYGLGTPVFNSQGKLYFVEGHLLRVIENGKMITLNGFDSKPLPENEMPVDGPVSQARFSDYLQLAIDPEDNLYILDVRLALLRKMTPDGQISTLPVINHDKISPLRRARDFAYLPSKKLFLILTSEKLYALDQTGKLSVLLDSSETGDSYFLEEGEDLEVTRDETIYFHDGNGLHRFRLD